MRFRNTLLLLLVLIGLGGYVYYVELPQAKKEEKKEKLVEFLPDDVTEIALTAPGREVVLVKADSGWRLSKPIEGEADEVTVKAILSTLSSAEVSKTLEQEFTDLAPFGLDKPTTIAMKAGDVAIPVVRIGETDALGSAAYALRGDGGKVLLTTSAVRTGVDKTLKDLRNKSILRFTDDAVTKIEITAAAGESLTLERSGEQWKITAPVAYAADASAVRTYLSTVRALRATDFADETADLAAYGLTAPKMSVTVTLADGTQQSLLVGGSNDKKEVWVKRASSPVVYTVGEWVGRDLAKPVDDFRDKTLLAFDKEAVKTVAVGRADGAGFTLTRAADGKWSLDEAKAPVPQNVLSQYVNDLVSLKGHAIAADGVTDLAAWGLAPPAMSVTITGADGAEVGTIFLGQREVEGKVEYVAMRVGSGTVLLVRDFAYTRLNKTASDLKTPIAAPADAGVSLEVLDPPDGE